MTECAAYRDDYINTQFTSRVLRWCRAMIESIMVFYLMGGELFWVLRVCKQDYVWGFLRLLYIVYYTRFGICITKLLMKYY